MISACGHGSRSLPSPHSPGALLAAAAVLAFAPAGLAAETGAPSPTMVQLTHPEFAGIWKAEPSVATRYTLFAPRVANAKTAQFPLEDPPLKPAHRAEYEQRVKLLAQGKAFDDPVASRCLPLGMPRMMATEHPFTLAMTSINRIIVYFPHGIQTRIINLDGRKLPPPEDAELWFKGHVNTARWEGDSLVIDSVGFNTSTFLSGTGVPHSDMMRITERVRLASPNELEWQITVTDPEVLTRPWTTTKRYTRVPAGGEGEDFICSLTKAKPRPPLFPSRAQAGAKP